MEFRAPAGQALERLTDEQLEDLGFQVSVHSYGALVKGEGETIIFTQWPIDPIFTQSSATTDRIRSASSAPPGPQAQPVQTHAGHGDVATGFTQGVVIAGDIKNVGEVANVVEAGEANF
ncbi:hypothetical protein OVA13_04335 [Pseudoxanthomonas sp. SL93]|uniref:hypothetical protein n=1 Tax=Pseudoxanthomonas sp. SL93 TaxID=2995142 RepID=UPI00226FBD52|nr:hypothetical protein [Pseudoxanthomonas sp. SL93]WAC64016.1 hypothetical protein OVA13_04335 [Pseudoxanthomonas sp. SL93]